jgi:hypothetical protein
MKRFYLLSVAGVLCLAILFGCEKKYIDLSKPASNSNTPVSYSTDIQPIWDAKCLGCHGTGGTVPVLEASVSYNNLISNGLVNTANPSSSELYMEVGVGTMGSLNGAQKNTILTWIQQGALNN